MVNHTVSPTRKVFLGTKATLGSRMILIQLLWALIPANFRQLLNWASNQTHRSPATLWNRVSRNFSATLFLNPPKAWLCNIESCEAFYAPNDHSELRKFGWFSHYLNTFVFRRSLRWCFGKFQNPGFLPSLVWGTNQLGPRMIRASRPLKLHLVQCLSGTSQTSQFSIFWSF